MNKEMWLKVWKWIEHNRISVIVPVLMLILWTVAIGCTPVTESPTTGVLVNAAELNVDFDIVMASFELARVDLERQAAMQDEFSKAVLTLASGSVAGWPGLVQMLVGGGLLGFIGDNLRKGTVISVLKNRVPKIK